MDNLGRYAFSPRKIHPPRWKLNSSLMASAEKKWSFSNGFIENVNDILGYLQIERLLRFSNDHMCGVLGG